MSQLPPANPSPEGTTPVYEPAFETAIHAFWVKNRQGMLVMCVTALLAIVGTYAWQSIAAGREADVQAEYAKISDQPAKLEGFANANSGHTLAGVAWLRLADEKFSAGDFKTAAADYQKATGSLKNDALLGRARLGAAMSQLKPTRTSSPLSCTSSSSISSPGGSRRYAAAMASRPTNGPRRTPRPRSTASSANSARKERKSPVPTPRLKNSSKSRSSRCVASIGAIVQHSPGPARETTRPGGGIWQTRRA